VSHVLSLDKRIARAETRDYMRRLRAGQPTGHRDIEGCDQCFGRGEINNAHRRMGEPRRSPCPLCAGDGYVAEALNRLFDRCLCPHCGEHITRVVQGCGVGHGRADAVSPDYCADWIPDAEAAAALAELGAV
jgi:hypothetical protein